MVPTFIAVAVIILSVVISLTLTPRPSVTTFADEDSPYRTLDAYAAATEEIMSRYAHSKTKLTIDTQDIERQLLERFPELAAARLRLPVLGRQPSLVLDIHPPALVLSGNGTSFVLDQSGTVVGRLGDMVTAPDNTLPRVQDQSGLTLEVGQQAVTTDTVRFITEIMTQLEAKNLRLAQLTLPSSANQLDIRIQDTPYYIKTDIGGSARLQMGSFFAVKQELEGRGEVPSEYIDVRVEEKVFYK
jgi:hypothetical protein